MELNRCPMIGRLVAAVNLLSRWSKRSTVHPSAHYHPSCSSRTPCIEAGKQHASAPSRTDERRTDELDSYIHVGNLLATIQSKPRSGDRPDNMGGLVEAETHSE
jgi:hypothetical protein